MEILSISPGKTKKIAAMLAKESLKTKKKNALVFDLQGDLGSGKTTFLQGFAEGLGVKDRVLSPTFVIFRKMNIRNGGQFRYFYHFDCYRIKDSKELSSLGFEGIVSDPQNIVAVEWGDRIKRMIPEDAATLRFEFIDGQTRKITL